MDEFARGFRVTYPDGEAFDGAQFPNGFVVTCRRDQGLASAAVSLEHLLEGVEGAHVEWADSETREN